MPLRLGSVTPKPSQRIRVPSDDQPPPQGVSRVGSGNLNWRKVPVSGSTIVAAQFSSPAVQAAKAETWLPSGDQRGPPENPGKSRRMWVPSGFAVAGTGLSSRLPRGHQIPPFGLGRSE